MRRHARDHEHETGEAGSTLRRPGRRLTRQREAIWAALTIEPDAHLSADDVVARVRERMPRVNPSTVYRTLDMLCEEGLVLRTDLGADRAYYEPTHDHPHHHVVCERCGAVRHVHDESLGTMRRRVEAATGYALSARELTLFGLCPACHATASGSRAASSRFPRRG